MSFRPALFAVLALTSSLGAGCASGEAGRREEERAARQAARDERHAHVQQAKDSEDQSSPQMTVQGEEGTLNAEDVESALHEHFGEIRDCYGLGKRAAVRAGGRIVLRLFVDGKGEVDDVSVIESSVANRAVERCVADVALGVVFERPTGHKPTTFDYPVEFRPAREVDADRQPRP